MSRKGIQRAQRGFSLIELMIAIVVAGIVLAGIFAFSSIQQSTAIIQRQHVRVQQAMEGAMYVMGRDVRMAGLGFGRLCSEVRVYDGDNDRLLNPGSVDGGNIDGNFPPKDVDTDERYWVLRDGIQVFWRSGAGAVMSADDTSAHPDSPADAFDVLLGERNYTTATGVFTADTGQEPFTTLANSDFLVLNHNAALNPGDDAQTGAVQQLFPPGSFFLLVPPAAQGALDPFAPQNTRQCVLLQVTDDLEENGGQWRIPIRAADSEFNENLTDLMTGGANPSDAIAGDWPTDPWAGEVAVVPVGYLRWSRYEIDYSIPTRPYLVRTDIIGWRQGDPTIDGDPVGGAAGYPSCPGGDCPKPTLRLPDDNQPALRTAVAPMVEDMQISVGCDGYVAGSPELTALSLPEPLDPYQEDAHGGKDADNNITGPNRRVDEWTDDPQNDEWFGNAADEQWAPDCVVSGTGERNAALWQADEGAHDSYFKLKPEIVRITLVAKHETENLGNEADSDVNDPFWDGLAAMEDRGQVTSVPGLRGRSYQTLTERFRPANLSWRYPNVP